MTARYAPGPGTRQAPVRARPRYAPGPVHARLGTSGILCSTKNTGTVASQEHATNPPPSQKVIQAKSGQDATEQPSLRQSQRSVNFRGRPDILPGGALSPQANYRGITGSQIRPGEPVMRAAAAAGG